MLCCPSCQSLKHDEKDRRKALSAHPLFPLSLHADVERGEQYAERDQDYQHGYHQGKAQ